MVVSDAAALFFSFSNPLFFLCWFHALSHEGKKKEKPGDDEKDLKAQFAGSRGGWVGDRRPFCWLPVRTIFRES